MFILAGKMVFDRICAAAIPLRALRFQSLQQGLQRECSRIADCTRENKGLSLFLTPQMPRDFRSDVGSLLCAERTLRSTADPSAFAGSSRSLGLAFARWARSH